MYRPSPEDGYPEPFTLARSSRRHFASTVFWVAVALSTLWCALNLYVRCNLPGACACLALAGWATLRLVHNFRLLGENPNLLIFDAAGISAPRLYTGALPWSAVQGALCGAARGALILRVFADAKALAKLEFRGLSEKRHDRFDLTFGVLALRRSLDFAARPDVEFAALACNEWVAAEAGRFALLDDPSVDKARRFAQATRSLISAPSRSSKAELVLAVPFGFAFAAVMVWGIVALIGG